MITDEDIKLKTIANCPITIENMGKIYAPSLREISLYGENDYFYMGSILVSTIDDLKGDIPEKATFFDYLISLCSVNEDRKNKIISFLKLIFKEDVTCLPENRCFFIGKDLRKIPANEVNLIDNDNFEILQKILRIQNGFKEKPKTKPEKKTNSRVEKIKKKREKGRKVMEKAKGGDFSLENMISTLAVFYLDIDKVLNMNFYQANNQYAKLMRKDQYEKDYSALMAGAKRENLRLDKHWSIEIKNTFYDDIEKAPDILSF